MLPWWSDVLVGSFLIVFAILSVVSLGRPALGSKLHGHLWPNKFMEADHRRLAHRAIIAQTSGAAVWGVGFVVAGLIDQFGQTNMVWDTISFSFRFVGMILFFFVPAWWRRKLPRQYKY